MSDLGDHHDFQRELHPAGSSCAERPFLLEAEWTTSTVWMELRPLPSSVHGTMDPWAASPSG